MNTIKAYIAGLVLPATILPLGMYVLHLAGKTDILTAPSVHAIPVFWGLWNVLYFAFLRRHLPANLDLRLFITGALLGFLVALWGIFCLQLPQKIGFPEHLTYAPLLMVPLLYGVLWRFIVKPLNDLVGLCEKSCKD